jgi:uncharacterized protein with ParB-like and HNH nuclease domain
MADWFDDYADEDDELQIDEYDITATPNDFNVSTLFNFIESGAVRIPGFQRNFVWDQVRASKLIESLILGIPVPQLFLYEQARNRFLVIDGQQRLMSIYYFIKRRFPRKEKRVEIRGIPRLLKIKLSAANITPGSIGIRAMQMRFSTCLVMISVRI